MKQVLILHGGARRKNTLALTREIQQQLTRLGPVEFQEIFLYDCKLPPCCGCMQCLYRGAEHCPHWPQMQPLLEALDRCDGVILTSPVYVMDVTGTMKTFLDHLAWRFLIHRPQAGMFCKAGWAVATSAGNGLGRTLGTMQKSLGFWGVSQVEQTGVAMMAEDWEHIPAARKARIQKKLAAQARRFYKNCGRYRAPAPSVRGWFAIMRQLTRRRPFTPLDGEYWEQTGWHGAARPWKGPSKQ